MKLKIRVLVAVILCWAVSPLVAQEFTGRVMDKTGAVVPNAAVTAHNVDTGVNIKATTNGTGSYTIPYLHHGNYTVSAQAKGFKESIREGIDLQVDETSVVNFSLEVGDATETVTVTADTVLDIGKADVGEVVENKRVTELPLNGRDPMMLSELAAGVTYNSTGYTRPFDDTQANTSINGGGNGNVEILLDGTPNTASPINITGGGTEGIARSAYTTPVDSVQEFKMVTSPYDSQYGLMAGGVEDVILKSGTNMIHGDVYEFARRTWLNANSWENNWGRATAVPGADLSQFKRAESKWDQYGFELDGPIVMPKLYNGKNRSFFTVQWEHFHAFSPLTDTASVPDPAWANGDFSNLDYWTGTAYAPKQIYDPATAVLDTNSADTNTVGDYVRTQYPGNKMPSVDPLAQKIMKFWPKPNVSVTSGRDHWSNNYVLSTAGVDTYDNALVKWDENLSAHDRFSLRYGYWMWNNTYNGNGLPAPLETGAVPDVKRSHTFALEETHTFNPNLLFDFRAGVTVRADLQRGGVAFDPTTLGWSQSEISSLGGGGLDAFPRMCFGSNNSGWYGAACNGWGVGPDYTNVGSGGNTESVKDSLNLLPTVTWIKGTHSIRGGIDVRLWQNTYPLLGGGVTIWTNAFWTTLTASHAYNVPNDGNDFASFLTGVPTYAGNQIWPQTYQSEHYFAPFVQDDWKVTRKLTLNLGLRWDWIPGETERHNKGNGAFDTTTPNPYLTGVTVPGHSGPLVGGLTFAGVNGQPRTVYKTDNTDWQPRLGFAYAVNNKTVLRGGFGKSMQTPQNGFTVAGFSAATTGVTSDPKYGSGTFPNFQNKLENLFWGGLTGSVLQPTGTSLGLGTDLGQGFNVLNAHYKNPSFWSYSLGAERQFLKNSSVNVSYVGSRLYDGSSQSNINLPSNALRVLCNPISGGNPYTCDSSNNAKANSPNPFLGLTNAFAGTSYGTNTTMANLDLSRPMPQFGDVNHQLENDARTWYNSLQITVLHKFSDSLTLHGTETWSKQMDAGTWLDQNYGTRQRGIDNNDMPHRITISGIYELPVGRGRMLFHDTNRLVDAVIGGWELSSLFIWQSGTPQGMPGYILNNAHVKRHIDKSTGYIRVFAPYAEHYVQVNNVPVLQQYDGSLNYGSVFHYTYDGPNPGSANFMDVPTYAPAALSGNPAVNWSGIRTAGLRQFDSSFAKNFALHENLKLQLRVDAFNLLNHPEWTGGADTGTSFDANLGTITKGPTGASNNPRAMQLSAKIVW